MDEKYKAEVQRSLKERNEDLEEARRLNDPRLITAAQAKRDEFIKQLGGSLGPKGRSRKFANENEKARKRVSMAIERAYRNIESNHLAL